MLIIPNCYPFNVKLKEDIQFNEEDVIRWCVGQKIQISIKYIDISIFFFAKHRK